MARKTLAVTVKKTVALEMGLKKLYAPTKGSLITVQFYNIWELDSLKSNSQIWLWFKFTGLNLNGNRFHFWDQNFEHHHPGDKVGKSADHEHNEIAGLNIAQCLVMLK